MTRRPAREKLQSEIMSLTATARAIPGTLRQQIQIDGRHRLVTDQPAELGGDGSGPSPHELLPAGLAACVASTLVVYARTKGWDLGDVTVDVEYDNKATPRTVDMRIRLDGELTGEQVERLEKVARACPLRRSLETGFAFADRIDCAGGAAERTKKELSKPLPQSASPAPPRVAADSAT